MSEIISSDEFIRRMNEPKKHKLVNPEVLVGEEVVLYTKQGIPGMLIASWPSNRFYKLRLNIARPFGLFVKPLLQIQERGYIDVSEDSVEPGRFGGLSVMVDPQRYLVIVGNRTSIHYGWDDRRPLGLRRFNLTVLSDEFDGSKVVAQSPKTCTEWGDFLTSQVEIATARLSCDNR